MSPSTVNTDLDNALQLIARQAQTLTLASGAAIALTSPEKAPNHRHPIDEMTCRASAGDDAPGVGARLHVGSGFSGECVRERKLLRCDDSETDARVDRDSCRRLGIRSMVAAPVKDGESVLGIIEIFSPRAKAFTEGDITELQGLAEQVTSAVKGSQHAASAADTTRALEGVSGVSESKNVARPQPTTAPGLLPTVHTISSQDLLWTDVFVPSGAPWKQLSQSALWHLVLVAAILNLSQGWGRSEEILRRTTSHNSHITFPTAGSYRSNVRAVPKARGRSPLRPILVRAGSPQRSPAPPAVKLPSRARLSLVAWIPRPQLAAPVLGAPTLPRQANLASPGRPGLVQTSIVAPPPQVAAVFGQHAGAALNSFVVSPSPSIESSIRRLGDVKIGDSAVVGPPPGMPAHEPSSASGVTLGNTGAVVGPPPGMPLREPSGLSGVTLGGTGTDVVPPPPSLGGSENLASGRGSSLSGSASHVAAPIASIAGADALAGGIRRSAMNIPPTSSPLPPPRIEEPSGQAVELPMRLLGLALALPNSSYFSNYEVFIAERRVANNESQLIKLVYESRPYQQRMSEYGLSDAKVYKLRVTRDATCDETALQMTGSHYSELQTSIGHRAPRFTDPNSILPCYRTTMDDYLKALARGR